MTQEEKELLMKDLCARLPYGVRIQYDSQACKMVTVNDDYTVLLLGEDGHKPNIEDDLFLDIEKAKPYLRPMSSMTEEEKDEYSSFALREHDGYLNDDTPDYTGKHYVYTDNVSIFTDWLNKHHFDYRGLIEKGLAIAVTEENNPYKK